MIKWIRPLLSLIAMGAVTAGFFMGKIDPATYGVFAFGIIMYWFKSRDSDKDKNHAG